MKIAILTAGTRGDVQPYVAVGVGLQAKGHRVRIATHRNFKSMLDQYGLDFSPVEGDPRQILMGDVGQKLLSTEKNPIAMMRHTVAAAEPVLHQVFDDYWEASQGADVILFHLLAALPAASIAEKRNVPAFPLYLQHVHHTWHYPSAAATPLLLGIPFLAGLYNRLTYKLEDWAFWHFIRSVINHWREHVLGLPAYKANPFLSREWQQRPFLYGFSPRVVPKAPDWGDNIHITGYWFLPMVEDWRPPKRLVDFLQSGSPPVYIGFGSMVHRDAEEMTEIVLKALQMTNRRGVLAAGWGGLSDSDLPDHVIKIDFAPHDWLFPRMAAVVHHGGAGTTAAGLRAGVPSVIVPFFGDQPFWGWRVAALGVGPPPIPRKKLTAKSLAKAMEFAVNDEDVKRRAEKLGEAIRAERGVDRAVEILTEYFASS
ncbi:MAG: glycosyltransferase family 1 protein [Chloroflexi bacterium]|nr:glycosyltransferase family 1 protein [Chloroflexota bacterium]